MRIRMKNISVVFAIVMTCLCCLVFSIALADDWNPLISTEAAMITLEKSMPAPLPRPSPEPDGAKPGSRKATGPLDMLRDARTLLDKGQDLADRGKAILDQAEQDGKITLDVRLPKTAASELVRARLPSGCKHCTGVVCTLPPSAPAKAEQKTVPRSETPPAAQSYPASTFRTYRPKFFRRCWR